MANTGEAVAALRRTAAGLPFTALADALGLVEEARSLVEGAAPHLDHVQTRSTSPQQLLAGLPSRVDPGGKTSGYWVDQDGGVHGPIVSGRGEPREQAVEGLRRLGLVSPRGTLTVADHVEVQVAVQVQTVAGDVVLAVNNRPCDVGPLSCDRVVPRVLRPYVGRKR